MATICIFGDSITWGASDTEGGGWVTRLRNFYESEGLPVDQDVDVYNLGVSGDNTDDLLKRFDIETEAREPSTILFAIGINDSQFIISKGENRISESLFQKNLEVLFAKAKALTSKVAFIGLIVVDESKTIPIPWNTDENYTKENRDRYDSVIRKLCTKNHIPYLDMDEVVSIGDLSDGLHPNTTGHKKMFEAVRNFLKSENLV